MRRVTTLEVDRERIFCEVYPSLLGIVGQSIKDELEVERGNCLGRHRARRAVWGGNSIRRMRGR